MEWRFNLLLIIALLKKIIKSVSLKDKAIYFKKPWSFIVTLKSLYCSSLSPIQISLPDTKFYSCAVLSLTVLSCSCPLQPSITYFISPCHLPAFPSPASAWGHIPLLLQDTPASVTTWASFYSIFHPKKIPQPETYTCRKITLYFGSELSDWTL